MKKVLFIILSVFSVSALADPPKVTKVTTSVKTESSSLTIEDFTATFETNVNEEDKKEPFVVNAKKFSAKSLVQDQIVTSAKFSENPYYLKKIEFTYLDAKTKQPITRVCTPEGDNPYHIAHIQFFGNAKTNAVLFTITRVSKRIKFEIKGLGNPKSNIDMKNCENITDED